MSDSLRLELSEAQAAELARHLKDLPPGDLREVGHRLDHQLRECRRYRALLASLRWDRERR